MLRRALALLLLVLPLASCGSGDDGGGKSCPDLGAGGPTFAPDSAKSGESVVAKFQLEPGSPGGSCPVEITMTCGAKQTKYTVNVNGKGETESFALDCSGEAAAVECTSSFNYGTGNSVSGGFGNDGPTCAP